jgi:hypothetical protein
MSVRPIYSECRLKISVWARAILGSVIASAKERRSFISEGVRVFLLGPTLTRCCAIQNVLLS